MSLETAAAIIGLGALATELFTKIHHFVSTCADAPSIAKDISDEVRDFDYAIHRLRGHIDRTTPITPCGASATDVNQLSLTLQSCMATLSLLSRLMERLLPNVSGMNYLRRVRWGMAAGDLDQLLSRLQRNKSSLNLLMSIWASESSAQTEQSLDTLNDVLKSLLTHNGLSFTPDSAVQPTHLSLRDVVDSTMSRMKASDAISLHGDARSITSKHTHCTTKSNHSLRSILRKTRPYSGRYLLEGSAKSIATSKRGMQWSKLTLGSNQSVFSLPFTEFHLAGRSLAVEEDIAKIKVTVPERGMYCQALYPPYNFSSLSMTKALEKMNLKPMTTSLALQKDQEESIKNDLGVSAHDIEMITKVIKSGAYPDGQFVMVMYKRSARLGEMVLDRACIPDQSSATLHPVLCAAIRVGDWALAQALFDGHLIPDDGCIRPDWRRVALQFIGHEAAISKLLSKGAPVQTIEPNVELPAGNTPLIAACELKNIALVRFLLRNGANAGLKSSTGKTPLHQSVAQPIEPTILKLLVEAGAGIDTLTQEGYTPLSLFVIRQEGPLSDSDSEALDLLLSSGADTTIADHNGNS